MDRVVKLTNTIEYAGQTYTELTFSREMRMKDMFAMDDHEGPTARTAALYSSMAGVPFEVIAELTNADMANAAQAVAAFSGKLSEDDSDLEAGQSENDGTSS